MSAEYHLPLLAKTDPPCSAVSAINELGTSQSTVAYKHWNVKTHDTAQTF